jgi:putative oxidoreductase
LQKRQASFAVAMLLLRLALASVMIVHGWMKVHHGMPHHVQVVQSLAMPGWLAYFSAAAEFGGGILVLIGLLTRCASLFILINMLVAIVKVQLPNALRGGPGKLGYEFPMVLAVIALVLLLLGGGPIAVDWLFRRDDNERRRAALR